MTLGTLAFAAILLAVVLKFKTPKGTIVVEVDGETNVEQIELVSLADGTSQIHLVGKTHSPSIVVNPGSYLLQIKSQSGELFQTNLTENRLKVYSGAGYKVRAWIEQASSSPPDIPVTNRKTRQHSVATEILELGGGQVYLRPVPVEMPESEWDNSTFLLLSLENEFPTYPTKIVTVAVRPTARNLPPKIYDRLFQLPNLTHIHFGGDLTDEQFARLASPPPLLNLAKFNSCRISNKSLGFVAGWKNINDLSFINMEDFDDKSLALLTSLTNLQTLTLDNVNVSGDGLKQLATFKQLINIQLRNLKIGDTGMIQFCKEIGLQTNSRRRKIEILNCNADLSIRDELRNYCPNTTLNFK